MLERMFALLLIILLLPVYIFISLFILLSMGWPIFFIQERVGFMGKKFKILKFRTMVNGAEKLQDRYRYLNEANGPVFKINDDPRFTSIGRFLSHTGLDELPQLFNVILGQMSIVGPRPLPVLEAESVKGEYKKRELELPGIVSPWLFNGYHNLTFEQWMKSDIDYISKKCLLYDLKLLLKSILCLVALMRSEVFKTFNKKNQNFTISR